MPSRFPARVFLSAWFLSACLALPAAAEDEAETETLAVGDRLPVLTLEDQHGASHTLDAATRLVIFSREMEAGDVVEEALADRGGEILAERRAVYVADVHRMPGLIRRMFALPSLRKRPYPMWLDTEGEVTAAFPAVEGRPTLFFVEDLVVQEIQHPASAAELRLALGLAPEPAAADAE